MDGELRDRINYGNAHKLFPRLAKETRLSAVWVFAAHMHINRDWQPFISDFDGESNNEE